MLEKEFVALMYCGRYVDANLLEKGIYTSSIPFIYDKQTTIDDLKSKVQYMIDKMGTSFVSEKYLLNLDKCDLVPFKIEVIIN